MGFLKGTINTKCPAQLPLGSVLKLVVFYIPGRPERGPKILGAEIIGKKEMNIDAPKFPMNFTVDYNDPISNEKSSSQVDEYAIYLTAYVEKSGQLLFNNENPNAGEHKNKLLMGNEYGDLVGRNGRSRRHLDVFLNYVKDQ